MTPSLQRWMAAGAGALLAATVVGFVALKLLYGGGRAYPDVAAGLGAPEATAGVFLEVDLPLANVVSSPDGRVFFNLHNFGHPKRFGPTVFEVVEGEAVPYPSRSFQPRYQGTFGMTVDVRGRLWLIETASLDHAATRLLAFDLATNELVYEHTFSSIEARFGQDLRMAPDGRTLIIADTGMFHFVGGALIVFDTEAREVVRSFSGHSSLDPQNWVITRWDGAPHRIGYGLLTFAVGVDGLAIDRAGEWVYYATMSHDTLYRVPLAALSDPAVSHDALVGLVEVVGPKPLSDGIEMAPDGTVLVTDIEHGGLMRLDPATGELESWTRDPTVIWADGVTVTPEGHALYTDSGIPAYLHPLLQPPSEEALAKGRPYRILQVPAAPASEG